VVLEQMAEAEGAVREAAKRIPADMMKRFETAKDLATEDRAAIVQIARVTLSSFQAVPEVAGQQPQTDARKAA